MKEGQIKVNVNFRILPFGYSSIQVRDLPQETQQSKKESPTYHEPQTTNLQQIEIVLDGENYIVPKTTGGLL